MKVVEWANIHANKNIVIIAKTAAQGQYIFQKIKRTPVIYAKILSYSTGNMTMTLMNDTKIIIAPEYHATSKFRGMSIDVLLFCNVDQNVTTKHILPQIYPDGIIGELKI